MAAATIIKAWKDALYAYASAVVAESQTVDGVATTVNVEYQAKTPLHDAAGNLLNTTQLKQNLTTALSAVRNAQLATTTSVAISGPITV
jgi:hypothetical protein